MKASPYRRQSVSETGRRLLSRIASLSLKLTPKNDSSTTEKNVEKETLVWEITRQHVDLLSARKPGVIPKMWTPDEDELLKQAVRKHGEKNWRDIAEDVPHRNHLQCLQRWKKALRPGLVKGHWSKEEDDYLLQLMNTEENKSKNGEWNWANIAKQVPGRNAKQCRERWNLNLNPDIYRGPWTAEEDVNLMKLYVSTGGRWSLISKGLEGRTENAVKTRYHSIRRKEIKLRGWTEEEDETLTNAVMTYGRNYASFTRLLPGRSRGQMKKRFVFLLEKHQLVKKVEEIEKKIKSGHKPIPIHVMVKQVNEKRQKNAVRQQQVIVIKEEKKDVDNTVIHKGMNYQYDAQSDNKVRNSVDNFAMYLSAELESAANMAQNRQKSQGYYQNHSQHENLKYETPAKKSFIRGNSFVDTPKEGKGNTNTRIHCSGNTSLLHELLMNELDAVPVENQQQHQNLKQQAYAHEPSPYFEVDSSTYPSKSGADTGSGNTNSYTDSQAFLGKLLNSVSEIGSGKGRSNTGSSSSDEADYSGYDSPVSATDSFPDLADENIHQNQYQNELKNRTGYANEAYHQDTAIYNNYYAHNNGWQC
mmetsp:Transcript_13695/g.17790  ORF Transcript_13695/g.17790 Transcript_13695/m.17790 type:complete len:587 (+) Transcript_13695:331-2091(+)|eukprot:CAMPEP_0204839256 /NCGR_PEP_ID=MMETSP1346-20131115/33500_1 /ASSEMBLY_ACC=CAM_ASM_000771 /TAXON_ID=215587 /ORGANISM="Aplanochytrium stocchinoi, Strain GSBS06" /LENGTH=586 /DNA_ID=CAMNT_0051975835 /DNA_START=201 /DNA_END=1961 /DNA_ORIENTATION=-